MISTDIPSNLTLTPAGVEQLKHEASTPGYPHYSETAEVLVGLLDDQQARHQDLAAKTGDAFDVVQEEVAELGALIDKFDEAPPELLEELRNVADRLEEAVFDVPEPEEI